MKNTLIVNGEQYELAGEAGGTIVNLIRMIAGLHRKSSGGKKLAEYAAGEVVTIGGHEMVILEQSGDTTALIRKDLIPTKEKFGSRNNYDGSYVDAVCNKFAEEIASVVGEGNLVLHTVDLTSDDGLKDYGKVKRRASLLTAELYRRYVDILDNFKPDSWWWLATPFSTKRHDNNHWVKCVSPSGVIINDRYGLYGRGVRPFCILKSDIFVSR